MKSISILCFVLVFHLSSGQPHRIIPHVGIEGVPIVLDSSNISEVIKLYGDGYRKIEHYLYTNYFYEELGLTFSINPIDKNQLVREISIQSPFEAYTDSGIVLNKSSMNDVLTIFKEKGCYISQTYAYRPEDGITFYIKKDSKDKGFNREEEIFKIEINNRVSGISSRTGFEYNKDTEIEKIYRIIAILNEDDYNQEKLDSLWSYERNHQDKPYYVNIRRTTNREIEYGLIQQNISFAISVSDFNLNILKTGNGLLHIILTSKDTILFERKDEDKMENLLIIHEKETGRKIDIYDPYEFPTKVFVYGTGCGITGIPPKNCSKMIDLVINGNYQELSRWLYSLNPEVATYGCIGLELLRKNDVEIMSTEIKRMDSLEDMEIKLYVCRGCIYGYYIPMKKILSKGNIKYLFKEYKDWFEYSNKE